MKNISLQFIKYFGVAGVGYIIDIGTLILLKELFGLHYLISASIAFILGLVVVYTLSRQFVFGAPKLSKRNDFIAFATIGLVGLGILSVLMWTLTNNLQMNYVLSKIIATTVVYAWNFFARRTLYYNDIS